MFYAVRMTDKKAFKLTRREYYHLSGVNDRVFQMAKLKEGLEAYHGQLSREGSLKFGTFEDLIPGLVLRVRGYQRAGSSMATTRNEQSWLSRCTVAKCGRCRRSSTSSGRA